MRVIPALVCVLACSTPEPAPSTVSAGSAAEAAVVIDATSARVVELVDAGGAVAGPSPPPPIDAAVRVARVRTPEDLRLESEAQRMADLLTSGDDHSLLHDMSKRRPGADLGAVVDTSRDSLRVGGGGGRGTRGDAIGGVKVGGAGGPPGEKRVQGRVTVASAVALDDTTLTADAVSRKIQMAYLVGIRRCHQQLLVGTPQARGRLEVELTVTPNGRTTAPKVKSFDATLDTCVTSLVPRWSFPVPKDADDEPTDARFALAFRLDSE